MHSIQFYLTVNETSYNNDAKKIAFTLSYMTEGSALTWADTFCENVKAGFTLEVTPRKSRVEGGWDLASPYVVRSCLHAQWSCISGLVGGGDKDLSRGVNKPVRVGLSRLSE